MSESFESLIDLGASADVSGWDFSWLEGRATEQRPPWGYARQLDHRLSRIRAERRVAKALDAASNTGFRLIVAEAAPLKLRVETAP
ncbi:hypothetical protein [Demetria terragena]|uniref:hypothetical protein n=1 Tax=Demetria terragena TaxID=63959 RepID=UPI00037B3460|nr:hypothetical protein [Demetria terragena]